MKKTFLIAALAIGFAAPRAFCNSNELVGTWIGTATTPWTTPYKVKFIFNEDETFTAKALETPCMLNGIAKVSKVPAAPCYTDIPALVWNNEKTNLVYKNYYHIKSIESENQAYKATVTFDGQEPHIRLTLDLIDLTFPPTDDDRVQLIFSIRRLPARGLIHYNLVKQK